MQSDKCFIYPKMVDSLHMQDLYDSTRWYVYTNYCDVLYEPTIDSQLKKPFGELELKFDNLSVRNDTVIFIFNFIDKGQVILPSSMKDGKQLATGIGFDIKTRKKVYEIFGYATASYKGDPTNRYINPMQPEVIKYIHEDWYRLDPCFRALAEKKGITK